MIPILELLLNKMNYPKDQIGGAVKFFEKELASEKEFYDLLHPIPADRKANPDTHNQAGTVGPGAADGG